MCIDKPLSIGFVAMLLLTVAMVMVPASVAAVPAQSTWIDPTYPDPAMSDLEVNDTFTVDAMVNVTSPTSPGGTGMFGFEYKLFWNYTYVDVTSYATHIPSGWEPPNGFLVYDDLTVPGRHWYAYTCLTGSPFTGVMSVCTYKFTVTRFSPHRSYFNGTLDLCDVKMVDDTATTFVTDIPPVGGTVQDGTYQIHNPFALEGDINSDRIVDINDVVIAALGFGSSREEPNIVGKPYNPDADINYDGLIDICDLVIIGVNFGKTL